MAYSVTQAARAAGVSDTTIRQWTRQFADFLSPGANPGRGEKRQYDEDDLAVFVTAAVLRAQLVEYEDIADRLAAGERLEPMPGSRPEAGEDEEEPAPAQAFSAALAVYERQLAQLQTQLQQSQEDRLAAEIRAVAAETELRLLRQQQERHQEPQPEKEPVEVQVPAAESLQEAPTARRGLRQRLARWIGGQE